MRQTLAINPPHSLFRRHPGAEGRKATLWCSWGHGILVASSSTLEPDSPQGTLLSQMFPGYADVYFTGDASRIEKHQGLNRIWREEQRLRWIRGPGSRAPEVTGTMLWVLVGAVLPVMLLAAPPPINKLALFPDKSAWCEAKNITQIVGHSGCEAKSIQNRACLGQCFSYSVPNTFPQSTESLVHCDSCMPAQSMWEIVTLECPGHEEVPRVDKLVEKIVHCSCQACGKEPSHEGLNVYVQGEDSPGSQPGPHSHAHPHPGGQTPEPEEPPGAPQVEEEGAED